MKAQDLRIGNIVKYHNDDTIFNVIGIDDLGIRVKNEEQETWIEYDCFSPIPLNQEWIFALGFIKGMSGDISALFHKYYKTERVFNIEKIEDKYYLHYSDKYGMFIVGESFKYVHQLQNLYFALTGEELTLKD